MRRWRVTRVQHDQGDDVSSHADTIRRLLPLWQVSGTQGDRLRSEVDAMEDENQRLRDALERIATANLTRYKSELTFARRMRRIAREALAGDAE